MAITTMETVFESPILEKQPAMLDRILVIEHHCALQRILWRLLSSEGYEVDVAQSGLDGLEMLHRNRPSAVILDLQYPEASWFDFCGKIMHLLPGLPLVVLTSSPDPADEARLAELGAENYVTMPFSPRKLLERLRALMRRASCAGLENLQVFELGRLRGARCESWPMR
jgi:DNA-binding response OmpR family regulator